MVRLLAQATQPASEALSPQVWWLAGGVAALVVIPFLLAVGTSFLKLVVVGHILRSALGARGVPPASVITGLAIVLTIHIMAPTIREAYNAFMEAEGASRELPLSQETLSTKVRAAAEPVQAFLIKHAHRSVLDLFVRLRAALEAGEPVTSLPATQPSTALQAAEGTMDLSILVPAFVVSELSEAFQIGFLLFVPFLIIDLVVATVLTSMGMFMLSPVTVSLPIKLLLFVLVDGWRLITQGLVLGYS